MVSYYDIGVCHGFYPEQKPESRSIEVNQVWTNFEMKEVVESFLDSFLEEVVDEGS